MIVDAHQHFWNPARIPQAWMTTDHAVIARAFEPPDLRPLLVSNGVQRTIAVQGAALDADTDYLLEHSEANDWIGAVVAWVDLTSVAVTRDRLDQLTTHRACQGVRPLIHQEVDPHWVIRTDVLESLALVADRGLLLELPVVYPRHFDALLELAASLPALPIVVDHLGKPPIGTDSMDDWAGALRSVARFPNVHAKISGLNTMVNRRDWGADDLHDAIAVAVDCFGADRLMCGSDWPVCLLNGDYSRVWQETVRALERVAPDDLDPILGGTARSLYSIGSDEDSDGPAH